MTSHTARDDLFSIPLSCGDATESNEELRLLRTGAQWKCPSSGTRAQNADTVIVECDIQRQIMETGGTPGDECYVEMPDGQQYLAVQCRRS